MTRLVVVCALAAVAAGCAHPQPLPDDELEGKPWEAQKALLPSYPKRENLVPFYVGTLMPFSFFVDSASVSVRPDGIARYTLVSRSASGGENVSYEGIRCGTYETRTYAFGVADGNWAQARNQQWKSYSRYQSGLHLALADDFFCSASGAKTAEEAVRGLVRGKPR